MRRPTKALEVRVGKEEEEYNVTLFPSGLLEIRPKGTRKPEAAIQVTVGAVYRLAMLKRTPVRRKSTSRGLLKTERTRKP